MSTSVWACVPAWTSIWLVFVSWGLSPHLGSCVRLFLDLFLFLPFYLSLNLGLRIGLNFNFGLLSFLEVCLPIWALVSASSWICSFSCLSICLWIWACVSAWTAIWLVFVSWGLSPHLGSCVRLFLDLFLFLPFYLSLNLGLRVRLNFNLACFRFLRFVSQFGLLCPPLLGFVPFLAFLFVSESGLACPPELQFGSLSFLEVCLPIWAFVSASSWICFFSCLSICLWIWACVSAWTSIWLVFVSWGLFPHLGSCVRLFLDLFLFLPFHLSLNLGLRVRLTSIWLVFVFLRFVSPCGLLCPPLLGFVPFLAFLFVSESGLACPPELQFGLFSFLEVCLPIWALVSASSWICSFSCLSICLWIWACVSAWTAIWLVFVSWGLSPHLGSCVRLFLDLFLLFFCFSGFCPFWSSSWGFCHVQWLREKDVSKVADFCGRIAVKVAVQVRPKVPVKL